LTSPTSKTRSTAAAQAAFVAPETRAIDRPGEFPLELGGSLKDVRVAYRTWGSLAPGGDNAVVVCHALTGSADVDRWWAKMFGPGQALDPEKDFIVCSNILGSCYGTTGPVSPDPDTGRPYLGAFPPITIRDMVLLQGELARLLGIRRIRMVIGGSLGGMQALEWALLFPQMVESIVPIASPARHSPWAIGLSEAQRQTIFADPRWRGGQYHPDDPPAQGLAAARMMAMCTYRSRESFEQRFGRRPQTADLFAVESYLRYQGQALVDRFDAATYVGLTKAMDTHDVSRGRGEVEEVLRGIQQPALVVSIPSDVLYLPDEQQELAEHLPRGRLVHLESPHGHDAFLIEVERLSAMVAEFRGRAAAPAGRSRARAEAAAGTAFGQERVSLLVLGKGKVGGPFLDQVRAQRAGIERDYAISLRVAGIADSRRTLYEPEGIDLSGWREALAAASPTGPFGLPASAAILESFARLPNPVLVDLTAAGDMDEVYGEAFRRGIDVVGANKLPLAVAWARRERLGVACRQHHRSWRYETTVGASLPVIDTLQNLVRTGDRILGVEGALSGTLGHVTTEVMKGVPLSLAARWARELGYTERDPRDDLSGLDSARKAVILARELGAHAEVAEATVEPLVPSELLVPGSLDDLYEALRRHDDVLQARAARLGREGRALRYLARIAIEDGRVSVAVGPVEVEAGHRAAYLRGVESYVAFRTERFREHPLVVQGAGVGGESTAGGVLADVLRIAGKRGAF